MENFTHEQVLIPINSAEDVSIVAINGKPEAAIVGPEGVYHDTVTPLETAKDLLEFMKLWIGK